MTNQISRRNFGKLVGLAGGAALAPALVRTPARAATRTWQMTGKSLSTGLNGIDTTLKSYMQERNITCGSLAVLRKGKLVLARGYTWSSDTTLGVQPTSLFRIASLSKAFTATAVLRLVQDGKLKLTDRVVDLLPLGTPADPRLADVTVLRLMQHLGGWDRNITPDPVWEDATVAAKLGKSLPVTQADIMTFTTGLKLDHDPGSTYAYSNYGYLLLGQIIEEVSGTSYETYVKNMVLTPMQITRMRLGESLTAATGEVPYYSQYTGKTVMDASGKVVPAPYGTFEMVNNTGNGAWLASAVDLTRFGTVYDGGTTVLNSTSISTAFATPETGINSDGWYYGCGWMVRPTSGGGRNTWHDGSMPGTYTYFVRRDDGVSFVALFDQRDDASGKTYGDIDASVNAAINAVKTWPTGDLSSTYF